MKLVNGGGDLIPGLPNEISEFCLLHLPFPHFTWLRSVSSLWNQTLSNPGFFSSKWSLSLANPHLLVLAFDPLNHSIQWQALDPKSKSNRWFILPSMPIVQDPDADVAKSDFPICGSSLACAVDKEKGEMYVIGGMSEDGKMKDSVVVYSAATNSWRIGKGRMRKARSFFTAAAIGGRVFAAGSGDGENSEVECYDPEGDLWIDVAGMTCGIARYDAAVIGKKLLLTEGWTWPFTFTPRGSVYDADLNTWEDMPRGMREGWTGSSATVGHTLFVISEYGEGKAKAYDPVTDSWSQVSGNGIPKEVKKPYTVTGDEEGRIYVVGKGLDVGIGKLFQTGRGRWKIEWEVVRGPKAFSHLEPCSSQILYA